MGSAGVLLPVDKSRCIHYKRLSSIIDKRVDLNQGRKEFRFDDQVSPESDLRFRYSFPLNDEGLPASGYTEQSSPLPLSAVLEETL